MKVDKAIIVECSLYSEFDKENNSVLREEGEKCYAARLIGKEITMNVKSHLAVYKHGDSWNIVKLHLYNLRRTGISSRVKGV